MSECNHARIAKNYEVAKVACPLCLAARLAAAEDAIERAGRCLAMSNKGAAEALAILMVYKQAGSAPAALSAEEYCKLFCAWKGGGPCLADDCPRRKADQAPAAREDGPADEYLAGIMNRRKAPKP